MISLKSTHEMLERFVLHVRGGVVRTTFRRLFKSTGHQMLSPSSYRGLHDVEDVWP